ncbi:MAG: hypothetical protein WCH79_02920, partial [Planctomycetia bacterium]
MLPPLVVGHAQAEAEIGTVGGKFHDERAVDPAADRHAPRWEPPLREAGSVAVAHGAGGGWGRRSTVSVPVSAVVPSSAPTPGPN